MTPRTADRDPGQQPDSRIGELIAHLFTNPTYGGSSHVRDPFGSLPQRLHQFDQDSPLTIGLVVFAYPALRWYRVQTTEAGGQIGCCQLQENQAWPMGPREIGGIAPGTAVLIRVMKDMPYGIIVGALPPAGDGPWSICPPWIAQAAGVANRREQMYQLLASGPHDAGGTINFGNNAPVDSLGSVEWGKMTETGTGIGLDSFMAFLRVSEACGLFLNLYDRHARLSARNLDIWSFPHREEFRNDEGELASFRGDALYQWERMGSYSPAAVGVDNTPEDVQYRKRVGARDLADSDKARDPFWRSKKFGGYLGQGGLRMLSAPPSATGSSKRGDNRTETGLARDSLGVDGVRSIQSATGIHLVKNPRLVTPVRKRKPEDPNGDSLEEGNYKFAGRFGEGDPHVVRPGPGFPADKRSEAQVSGIADVLAYRRNWSDLHPFHYHKEDFDLAEEPAGSTVDFGAAGRTGRVEEPAPESKFIDHRYGEAAIRKLMSHVSLLDDGSIAIGTEFGSRIVLGPNGVTIDSAVDIRLVSGGTTLLMGRDVVVRAAKSVDVTAAANDVRIHAKNNLQLGAEGILVEATGQASTHQWEGRIGEEVRGSGLILRSKGQAALLGDGVYVRSGAGETGTGDVVVDGGDSGAVLLGGDDVAAFTSNGVSLWIRDGTGSVTQSHTFGADSSIIGNALSVIGDLTVAEGDLNISGTIAAKGSIGSAGQVSSASGGELLKTPPRFSTEVDRKTRKAQTASTEHKNKGDSRYEGGISEVWRGEGRLGNEQVLETIGFSYRDDDGGLQYRTGSSFTFLEPAWQTAVRLGAATGGSDWTETPVTYQSRHLYPWPGRRPWLETPCVSRPAAYLYLDGASAKPRADFEEAAEQQQDPAPLSKGLKINA